MTACDYFEQNTCGVLTVCRAAVLLQTFRPDGSARWQAVSAVHELPDASLLLAKIVRAKGEQLIGFFS
jgi:hypothetical protein